MAICVSAARADAEFVLINLDDPGEGLNDPTPVEPIGGNPGTTLGEQRTLALQLAFEIWGDALDSDVPIEVRVAFRHLACPASGEGARLAQARPRLLIRGDLIPGAADPDRWYAYALANRIAGYDFGPESNEVYMEFNSGPDTDDSCGLLPWYYGLDEGGSGPDFVRVSLHELAHGLGVASAVDSATGAFHSGAKDSFSALVFDRAQGKHLIDMTDEERLQALTHVRQLVWDGPAVREAAATILARGTPTLSIEPPVEGFSGVVSDANFGARELDRSITAELVALPEDSCSLPDDVAGRAVLVDAPCGADVLAQTVETRGGVALLYPREPADWAFPPLPLDYAMPVSSGIPVLIVARADADLLAAAVEYQPTTVNISILPEQLVGADPEGRLYLNITDSDSRQELDHWDLLARPNLLMEGAAHRAVDQRDLDVTVALLVDIGWAICGDGHVTAPEQCDDRDANSDSDPDACRTNCRAPACGDGVVDSGEECDNGAQNGAGELRACRSDCRIDLCGNAIVDSDEECDDGERNDDEVANACRSNCTNPSCGDGIADADEQCDEGGANGSVRSRCGADCELRGLDAGGCEGESCESDAATAPDAASCDGGTCEPSAAPDASDTGCACRVGGFRHSSRVPGWITLLASVLAWSFILRSGGRPTENR